MASFRCSRYHLSITGRPWTARAQSCRGCAPRWISRISTARVALALGAPLARLRRFDMILPLAGIAASAGPASYWSASTRPASASEYGVPEPFRDVPDDVFARREDALDWRHRASCAWVPLWCQARSLAECATRSGLERAICRAIEFARPTRCSPRRTVPDWPTLSSAVLSHLRPLREQRSSRFQPPRGRCSPRTSRADVRCACPGAAGASPRR